MFQKYRDYINDNPQKLWFKKKFYGWGWTPATWQGWLVTLMYAGFVLILALTIDENSPPREVVFTFILPLLLLSITLIQICYRKGEKPEWNWGKPKEK